MNTLMSKDVALRHLSCDNTEVVAAMRAEHARLIAAADRLLASIEAAEQFKAAVKEIAATCMSGEIVRVGAGGEWYVRVTDGPGIMADHSPVPEFVVATWRGFPGHSDRDIVFYDVATWERSSGKPLRRVQARDRMHGLRILGVNIVSAPDGALLEG